MAMLIAWQTLNKRRQPAGRAVHQPRSSSSRPGITIRDRLRVLLPERPENYYHAARPRPRRAARPASRHATHRRSPTTTPSSRREEIEAAALTKTRPAPGDATTTAFNETPAEMVRRVCRDLGHARRTSSSSTTRPTTATAAGRPRTEEDARRRRADARPKDRDEEARVWFSGLQAVRDKLGVKAVYDLSATPFYLEGSGYHEGTSSRGSCRDFSLMDAIESGIVKVPRIPVDDDATTGDRSDLPRPVGPRPRRAAGKGAAKDTPSTDWPSSPRSSKVRCAASTADYEQALRALGDGAGACGERRRCSSSSAPNTVVSQARLRLDRRLGEGRSTDGEIVVRARATSPLLQQRRDGEPLATGRARSSSTRRSSSRARR